MYRDYFTEDTFAIITVILLTIFVVFLIFVFKYSVSSKNIFKKRMNNNGFELIAYDLWKKGSTIFLVSGRDANSTTPIEITGIEEIRQNSILVQLEIRYRLNGDIKSMRIGGLTDSLLTIQDKLGYGG